MPDVDSQTVDENVITEKVYKTKDYVRRAVNNYRKKRYATDAEYREKQKETIISSQQKKPEKYREYKRLYMREYRSKKKLEKANANVNGGGETVNPDNSESDTITTKLAEIEM
jgi:hypothetical protein